MKNNFNRIAWCYDALCFMVFGHSVRRSQTALIKHIREDGRILIIGGGTGWIIGEILKQKRNVKIDYLEMSEKMLRKAKTIGAKHPGAEIDFILGNERSIPSATFYDNILACYFFDLFLPQQLEHTISVLARSMKAEGKMLVADFQLSSASPWWQKILMKIMYIFFKMTCRIEASSLPPFRMILEKNGWTPEDMTSGYRGFLCSAVYSKRT